MNSLLNKFIDGFRIVACELGGFLFVGEKGDKRYAVSINSNKCEQLSKGYDNISLSIDIKKTDLKSYYIKAKITENKEEKEYDFNDVHNEYINSLKQI